MEIYLFIGKPLAFWAGVVALISLLLQLYLAYMMKRGHPNYIKYHKINAFVLTAIVVLHVIFGILTYV